MIDGRSKKMGRRAQSSSEDQIPVVSTKAIIHCCVLPSNMLY